LTIEEVRDPEANAVWTAVLTRGFGMPDAWRAPLTTWVRTAAIDPDIPLRNYLGRYQGEPVAAASAYLGPHVAGIYNVATLERARGKGIGRAMTLAPLHEARSQGYRYSMLHASEMGHGVYRRIGYRDVGTMRQYEWSSDSNRG
jgi:ribosomal protein S18 acetylase RimI-like enzyme